MLASMLLPVFAEPVRVGAFNYYPAIFKDSDGEIKGFYVDAFSEIARLENLEITYVWGSWNEGLERIRSGEVDLLTSVAFTVEREKFMDYCRVPLLTVWGELYAPFGSEIDGIREVAGTRVGVMKGDFNAANFIDLTRKFDIACSFVEYPDFEAVFVAVASGVVDAGVANVTFGAAKQIQYKLRSTGVIFNPFEIYLTVAQDRNADLLEKMARYLENWKHQPDSVYNTARKKWTHGSAGTIQVVPGWLSNLLIGGTFLLLVALVFIVILRLQVRRATAAILARENDLRTSNQLMASYLENAPDGIFVANEKGDYLEVNQAACLITGRSKLELLKCNMSDLLPQSAQAVAFEHFSRLTATGHASGEMEFLRADGMIRWWSVDAVRLDPYRFLGFVKDITERKKDQDRIVAMVAEKDLLLMEVHHRIKNNMISIKSLLAMQIQAEDHPSTVAALKEVSGRIQCILMLYEQLYASDNYQEMPVRDYLHQLAMDVVTAYGKSRMVTIKENILDLVVNVQLLTPLGIMVNEIITNALKYAFAGRDNGEITLKLAVAAGRLYLTIGDDGIGLPAGYSLENRSGFGLKLVKMLVGQLRGTIQIIQGEGTCYIVDIPFEAD